MTMVLNPATEPAPPPLVLDLDHTLVRTDTLVESAVKLLFQQPLDLIKALGALTSGRAVFKRKIAVLAELDCSALPYNAELIERAKAHRASGGEVHLVTAADQSVADGVAAELGIFDTAVGSDGTHNLKGEAKAQALVARFPDGFAYAGDSTADLAVWARASSAIVVGSSPSLLARVKAIPTPIEQVIVARKASPKDWVRGLRLHQWAKNSIMFAPLLLSHELFDIQKLSRAIIGFVIFGVVASSTYLINDMSDLAADRLHPTKHRRPIASGAIRLSQAVVAAPLMLAAGLLAAGALNLKFSSVVATYAALTLLYSFKLKRQFLTDVIVIGILFDLRIIAGMVLAGHPISLWLSSFTLVLFTSLAMAKRHAELVRAAKAPEFRAAGRGYLPSDIPMTVALGISTGLTSVLVMLLYMQFEAIRTGLFKDLKPLFLIPLMLAFWVIRIWSKAHRGELHDDPVVFALRDKISWVYAAAVALLWGAANTQGF